MKRSLAAIAICSLAFPVAVLAASAGPDAVAATPPMATPQDRPYGGEIHLAVDTTDVERRIVHVHERLSGVTPNLVLLYPKWLPGNHAPTGPIERLAGLKITANGAQVLWRRDPVDIYAFRVQAPAGVKSIDIDFDYLSPTSAKVGPPEMSGNMLILIWNTVVLYPAGYYARQIPVEATLTLPEGWKFGSALEMDSTGGTRTTFKPVSLETLIDSPVYAGRYAARLDLDPTGKVPVSLDLFADHSASLVVKPEQLEAHRALVQQAYKLFASHHYAH
jgi:predicted metalloprotease with PDZ domain